MTRQYSKQQERALLVMRANDGRATMGLHTRVLSSLARHGLAIRDDENWRLTEKGAAEAQRLEDEQR